MRTITRYVLRDLLVTCAFTAVAITFVFFIGTTFRFLYEGTSYAQLLQVLPFAIPYTLPFTIPISLLVGTTLVYGRLVADNEVTALRAAGVAVPRLFVPAFILGLVATGLVWYLQSDFIPYCRYKKKDLQKEFIEKVLAPLDRDDMRISFPQFDLTIGQKRGYEVRQVEVQYHESDRLLAISAGRGQINVDHERGLLLISLDDVVASMAEFDENGVVDLQRMRLAQHTVDYPLVQRKRDKIEFLPSAALREKFVRAEELLARDLAEKAELDARPLEPPPPPIPPVPAPGLGGPIAGAIAGLAIGTPQPVPPSKLQRRIWESQTTLKKIPLELAWRRTMALASLLFVLVGAPLPLVLSHPVRLVPFFAGSALIGLLYFGPLLIGKGFEDDAPEVAILIWWAGCILSVAAGLILSWKATRQ